MIRNCPALLALACSLSLALQAGAIATELRLARVFADHGVLQRGKPVPVWGSATPGAEVSVEFAGQTKTATAAADGRWSLQLAPLKAHATGNRMTVRSGDERLEVRNLLVGEVWYASGQSNMQMNLGSCAKKIPEIATMVAAPEPRPIRTLRVGNPDTPEPLGDLPQAVAWQQDTPQNRRGQSAVAYFFARALHEELQVPIGIIEASWGGKPIEGFIPRAGFTRDSGLRPILELAEADDLEKLRQIEGGVIIRNTAGRPGRIFNSRVAPVAPYALAGFIWYQGESNAGKGEDPRHYRHKTRALVSGWRSQWRDRELPFYFVQLPSFSDSASGWVRLREEQRLSLSIPHTGMAVTIDLRDSDIHPANKVDVGRRLAAWALAKTYGRPVVASGPLFRSATVEGSQMRVRFDHVGKGLMVASKQGLDTPVETAATPLAHFELADTSGDWHAAEARIDGETVVVASDAVTAPQAVRYACRGAPATANLYNRAGLPASPFCSKLELLPWSGSK